MYTESLASELQMLWLDRSFKVRPMDVDRFSTFLVVKMTIEPPPLLTTKLASAMLSPLPGMPCHACRCLEIETSEANLGDEIDRSWS